MDTPFSLAIQIGTLLQYVAPHYFGDRFVAELNKPPRYVWVPSISNLGPPLTLGGNPRALAGMETTFNVHCWAKTHNGVTAMIAFLIKGTQVVCKGKRYTVGAATWLTDQHDEYGWLAIVPLSIKVDVHDLVIPTTRLANPEDGVIKSLGEVEAEQWTRQNFAVFGNGKIETGET